MRYDCVVIGGGLSGLAAGIRLAHYEKKVCVCEQHSRLGGLNSYYDRKGFHFETGLHAMTNYAGKRSGKALPINKIARQLRIPYDRFRLRPQTFSLIRFPDHEIRFTNCLDDLLASVEKNFPSQVDAFRRLDDYMLAYDALNLSSPFLSARKVLSDFLAEPELIDMLFCPLMYYGSAIEKDMDFSQFVIMFKSIFHEGFCRPGGGGIVSLINTLKTRYLEAGGELRTRCRIREIISEKGHVTTAVTDNDESIETNSVLSSAGYLETMHLCAEKPASLAEIPSGQLSFLEVIAVVDRELLQDHGFSIMFFNDSPSFQYTKPGTICNLQSGVICLPQNFQFEEEDTIPEPMLRVTALTNYDLWPARNTAEYAGLKDEVTGQVIGASCEMLCLTHPRKLIKFVDMMTPKTVERFTGHIHGAVYGSPDKQKDGRTHLDNLFLCGTDQGFLGIVGSMLSGISIANLHLL